MTQLTIQQAFDLAMQHHQAGRPHEAEQLYRRILAQQPENSDAMHLLGLIAHQVGLNKIAVDLIRRAITLNPNHAEAHNNLGTALKDDGRLDEAIAAFHNAILLRSNLPEAHCNLGVALADKKQHGNAVAAFRQAIFLRPNYPDAHCNLGIALREEGQLDAAIASYREAISLRPDYAEAHCNLGNALKDNGRLDEAITAYKNALAVRPNLSEGHYNLGVALTENQQYAKGIEAYRQAIALRPDFPDAHYNLGIALNDEGQLDEAIGAFRRATALRPDFPETHNSLGCALLMRGEYQEGWDEYEWRSKCKGFKPAPRKFVPPQWDGSPLENRTLLLHAEQGLGDVLQFIRFLPLVEKRGGKIIIECQRELERLLRTLAGSSRIVIQGEPLPRFDFHLPMLSLPRLFGTTLDNLPTTVPYLRAEDEEIRKWQPRMAPYSNSLKVALVWAGNPAHNNDRNRSASLACLAPLAKVPGVRFFSLQIGDAAAQAGTPPTGMELLDWSRELKDFAGTAALIANLDLIIAVDTAIVHLAGAMGKPVWTLLPFAADWRWLKDREDSPWYPSMRLFRQSSRGDWDSLARRVADELAACRCRAPSENNCPPGGK